MSKDSRLPRIMLLDGDYYHSVCIGQELRSDLAVEVIGIGTRTQSPLSRSGLCSEFRVLPGSHREEYKEALLEAVVDLCPEMVVPVGYRSVAAVDEIRSALPEATRTCLPPSGSIATALDKRRTMQAARQLGMRVPQDYTEEVKEYRRTGRTAELVFPLFLKAAYEAGANLIAKVNTPKELDVAIESMEKVAPNGEVIAQEYIDGNGYTYGYGALFIGGEVVLSFVQEEIRSIPREGGTGTRLRLHTSDMVSELGDSLLRSLCWNGVALVEFKRNSNGEWVLMEINPKFWASYKLASHYGFRFASLMVSNTLGLPLNRRRVLAEQGAMAFPLREFKYCLQHRGEAGESLVTSMKAMLWPRTAWDMSPLELTAELFRLARRGFSRPGHGDSHS